MSGLQLALWLKNEMIKKHQLEKMKCLAKWMSRKGPIDDKIGVERSEI